jgi:AcrR family transcriptional regulator
VPAKTERRHRQGDESRRRILDAALEIAAERGYDGTTVGLVTERTGLPASSVYWHFKSKDELLAQALEHSYRKWREAAPTGTPRPGDPATLIRRRMREVSDGLAAQPEFWRLGLMLGLLRSPTEIAARSRFLEVRQETLDDTARWWGVDLGEEAETRRPGIGMLLTQLFMAAADGLFVAVQTGRKWDVAGLTEDLAVGFERVTQSRSLLRPRRTGARPTAAPADAPPPAAEESRERLLAAAAEIAAERGYVGTTISRVCERSGLPVSSLYWFFEDKDQLLAEVVGHSFDEWIAHQPAWTPCTSSSRRAAALRRILKRSTRSLADAPDFLRIGHMLALERQDVETAARARFLQIRDDVELQLAGWFRGTLTDTELAGDDALPVSLARLVIAVTDGLFLGEQLDDVDWDTDAFVDLLVDLLEAVVAHRAES